MLLTPSTELPKMGLEVLLKKISVAPSSPCRSYMDSLLLWLILQLLPLLLVVTLITSDVLHRRTPAAVLLGRLRLGAGG
jgi:hypothetical protein